MGFFDIFASNRNMEIPKNASNRNIGWSKMHQIGTSRHKKCIK